MGTGKQVWEGQPATDHSMCEKQDNNNKKKKNKQMKERGEHREIA